ncbi:NAD(P)/FAD-dependent oxidoreductase [Xanthocytophaga agilis]|uniref:NAD(P)/FAD-dependent oxidoreductase n=1 Tax=Xanthocytophaga agilis TaxID=3048010 RepID=A0AAE3UJA9_9BACT|nr:NAD(P)/FAD-dependent oxidoreductase [Xanthocytophaga agilis]MDJ1506566.1 NAD(P)/FAD-dependent oxidoreductase [Xanthocytophaga agilis]
MFVLKTSYDVVIVGGGHNGLVSACYLAKAGKKVLIIEKNDYIGGATTSQQIFPDYDARLSRYSYLVSLFPEKIVKDLNLRLLLRRRKIASYTPFNENGRYNGLLISNENEELTQQQIESLHPGDYKGYQKIQGVNHLMAEKIWDSFLQPLQSRQEWERRFTTADEQSAWKWLIEKPIGELIESHVQHDILRGVLLTDAKIGAFTQAHDESLLQNRTYLYHVIGNKTGEWRVPLGGMGNVVQALISCANQYGVNMLASANVTDIRKGSAYHTVAFTQNNVAQEIKASYVLINAAPQQLADWMGDSYTPDPEDEGTAFKINFLLKRLPDLKQPNISAEDAFAGTFHINQSYSQMAQSYREAMAGKLPQVLPGEVYCHTLTDSTVMSPEMTRIGFHTLTLFGLDLPYRLFTDRNIATKKQVIASYIAGINEYLEEPLEACIAEDMYGKPCIEAKSALDLERELGMPQGNIFHNALSWFFAENADENQTWGVETNHERIYLCGSGARRGGAVSGIPGHNAAMKILSEKRK